MSGSIIVILNKFGALFCEHALAMLIQSSILILVLLFIDLLLRKRIRAVFRYCIWLLVFVKLVIPPTLSLPTGIGYWRGDYLPTDSIAVETTGVPAADRAEAPMTAYSVASSESPSVRPAESVEIPVADTSAVVPASPSVNWQAVILLGWFFGVLALAVLLMQRAWFVRGLIAQSEPAEDKMSDMLSDCCRQLGTRKRIELRISQNSQSPAACGLFKPKIMLPSSLLARFSTDKLRTVLLHELVHIKRGDLWINFLQTVLQIVYFYNPLLWLANAIVRRVREQAVDEMVLVFLGDNAKTYSSTLVDIAEIAFARPTLGLHLIGVVESKKVLAGRIKHIVSRPLPKSAKLGFAGLLAIIITSAVLLPMAKAQKYLHLVEVGQVADRLNVRWCSIAYKKTLYNPAIPPENRGQKTRESLLLLCEIEIPEPGLVLSASPKAIVEKITDSQGRDVDVGMEPSRSTPMYMENPLSAMRRTFLGTVRLPAGQRTKPEQNPLQVELDAGLRKRVRGEIGRLKGHFHALIAESLEFVEVPFKPNDNWVRLTPDVEIRVREARNEASMYQFNIEQRPENVHHLGGVRVGDYLPGRLVVARQCVVQRGAAGAGGGGGEGRIGGSGSGTGRAERIRYTIAVNPAHHTIPFELEHIPLSVFAGSTPSQARSSNRGARLPVIQHLQNMARKEKKNEAQKMREQPKLKFNTKGAELFNVRWRSITYSKTLYNPAASAKGRDQRVSESLTVSCEAEILDPKLVVGTCDKPIIEQVTDSMGRDTDISRAQPRSDRMYYTTPRYRPSRTLTPPLPLAQLEGKARSALKLPLRARRPLQLRAELQPVRMGIKLEPGLLGQGQQKIGRVKGYFHALIAKSFEHVEVPFEANDKWVRLTSDVEIQVHKAWHTGTAARYDIKQRRRAGTRARRLHVEDRLPGGIVVVREFIGAGGQPDTPVRGGRSLPGPIGGSGSHDKGHRIEKIDYLIAVGPSHHRIPFEFEHIPLP